MGFSADELGEREGPRILLDEIMSEYHSDFRDLDMLSREAIRVLEELESEDDPQPSAPPSRRRGRGSSRRPHGRGG